MSDVDQPQLTIGQQIHVLLEWTKEHRSRAFSLREVAAAAGISTQALSNILDGTTPDPRLNTLRNLCQLFQISLDYFSCQTEVACRDYLAQRLVDTGTPTVQQITSASEQLSSRARDNVLLVLQWLELSQKP